MPRVDLFAEDFGHESFLSALLQRLAGEYELAVTIRAYSVRGGHGKVIAELGNTWRPVEP